MSPETEVAEYPHQATYNGVAYLQGDQVGILHDHVAHWNVELSAYQQEQIGQIAADHFDQVRRLMDERMFPGLVVSFPEAEVADHFMHELSRVLEDNPTYAAVVLDRAMFHGLVDRLRNYGNRVQHLSLTRPAHNMHTTNPGGKVPRIGDPSFDVQLATLAEALEGYEAFVVDDTYVEGGTSKAARTLMQQAGIQLAPSGEDRFHFRAVRNPDAPWDDAQAKLLMKGSIASAEQREFTAIGGNHDGASRSNRMGYVVPGFAPFSSGAALRLQNRLDLPTISRSILDIDIAYIEKLEATLGREIRLIDVSRSIPTDASDGEGVRSLLSTYMQQRYHGEVSDDRTPGFTTFLRTTKLSDFLRFARERLDVAEKPEKDVVCVDMDGVIAKMQHVDGEGIGFKNSKLERSVRENALQLIMDLEGINHEAADEVLNGTNTEVGLVSWLTKNYGPQMEQQYGDKAVARIRDIFRQTLPPDIADQEADAFIATMPLAYHVFRVKVWDHNLDEIYEQNDQAAAFARQVIDGGGRLVFVTAAPRIHALKMLRYEGISEAAVHGEYDLYTIEDMYLPGTVEDKTYREGDKGMIMRKLQTDLGIPAERIAMGGDQFKSDVRAPIQEGVPASIIRGPEELEHYLSLFRLPRDPRGISKGTRLNVGMAFETTAPDAAGA